MKPSFASSYPVRACANEAGIDYGLALAWVDASDRLAARDARRAIMSAHSFCAFDTFESLIDRVYRAGRVRIRRWAPNGDGWALQSGAAS